MGLHTRRHDSSPGPLPPLSPLSISEPPPLLHHTRHESSPCPFPPISPPPPTPPISESQDFYHRASHHHNRRESLPGPSFPPMSPPPTTHHSRRESYPGPFPSPISPSSLTTPPQSLFHTRRESCPIPFPFATSSPPETNGHKNNISQLMRHESDPGLLPSTSSSFYIKHHHHHHVYNNHNKLLYNKDNDLVWPFPELNGLDHNDIRETAYEVFFTACRSEPGFGGRSALTFYSKNENAGNGNGGTSPGHGQVLKTSRVKRALGLRMLGSSFSHIMMSAGGGGGGGWLSLPCSPVVDGSPRSRAVPRRSMTMADVMRVQMRVSEHSESRLRKTLMRTLVGQVS